MKAPSPNALVTQCLALLRLHGLFAWRANCGGGLRRGRPIKANPEGTPDLLCVLPPSGRLLAVECKTGTGRVSGAQRAWMEAAERAGATCLVVRDVKELEAWLRMEGAIA